jgi:hypothetical protein
MSLADPLGLAAFSDLFKVTDCSLMLNWQQESSGSGSGETLYADRAPALWAGTVTTADMYIADAEGIMALLDSRAGGLKTMLLPNYRGGLYPSSDPDGSIFGSATPVAGTIADRFHLAFTGFPAGYVLPLGTHFQIVFDTSRYYLGKFAEARTADGSGAVTSVEVAPALPASISGGEAVTVIKPAAKFVVVPNTAKPTLTNSLTERISFDVKQTYRQ